MNFMARAKNQPPEMTPPKPRIKNALARALLTLLIVALELSLIYFIYVTPQLGLAAQWISAILSLMLAGIFIRDINGLIGWWGTYLTSTKRGISFIDSISKRYKWFWNGMAMWGIVLGLGLLSYPFLKGKIDKRLFVFGLVSLFFMEYYVLTAAFSGFQFINLPQLQITQPSGGSLLTGGSSPLAIIYYIVTLVFGFTGLFMALLLFNAGTIVLKALLYAGSVAAGSPNNSILQGVVPGVAPLIPGIDIPLVAGIASLAVLLIVHEFAHGILSRIAKIRVKSIGLLVLGIIPIGAFVEPDERQLSKLDTTKQSRILAAGSASNFVWAVIFFLLLSGLLAFIYPNVVNVYIGSTVPGYPAANVLQPGMQILYVNGYRIYNITTLENVEANVKPGDTVTMVTNTGTYSFTAIAVNGSSRGYIGYSPYEAVPNTPQGNITEFLYSFFSLSLLFNISLAVINLFPIPMFDGWRLYKANIKSKRIVKWFAIFITLLLVINVLAWVLVGLR